MNDDFGDTTIVYDPQQEIAIAPKVLLVDDDPLVGERLRSLVTAAGFDVNSATSGAAALESLRNDFAPIVIADRLLPDMDGLSLCRAIRGEKLAGYVYVLLLTVQDSEQDILAGLDAGADDYLGKRASSAQLVARLRTAQRILTLEHALRTVVEEKSRLATSDALTGASNRRYFTRHFNRELKRVQRYGGALSLLLLDIDHFKHVNDRFGHAVGDQVLQEFAKRIAAELPRESDWFARIGGEEFVVVLPQTETAGARVVAEKLRACVCAAPIRTLAGAIGVTASIGVAGLDTLMAEKRQATLDTMLDLAIAACTRAKQVVGIV
jgi:two-component system, cell cycle response regulator